MRQRTMELSELNRHLQDLREAERSQLAKSLHDSLGSLLTAAKLDIARLRRALAIRASPVELEDRIAHLVQSIDQGIDFKRKVIEALSPSALHNLGLRAALEILVSDLQGASGLKVTLDAPELERERELQPMPRIVAYRVVEACLNNIERHARVQQAHVLVRVQDDHLVVRVRDQGAGFVPSEVPLSRHDLANLRYRVETWAGSCASPAHPAKAPRWRRTLRWRAMTGVNWARMQLEAADAQARVTATAAAQATCDGAGHRGRTGPTPAWGPCCDGRTDQQARMPPPPC